MAETLEKLHVEGTKYHKSYLKELAKEIKENGKWYALEKLDHTRLTKQDVKAGYIEGILISWGGGAYRWIWSTDENGLIKDIQAQYQDWFMPFVNVATTKTDQRLMIGFLNSCFLDDQSKLI